MTLKKPDTCRGCPLYRNGFGFSALEGDGSLMVIAESLGRAEEREGLPLRPHAPSGGVFQRALDVAGLKRSTMTLTNTIRCKSEAPHPRAAIDHCKQHLDAAVAQCKPKLLLALGDVPLRELSLLGGSNSISEVRGYVLPSRYGIPMIATYHPSHLARGAFGQLFGVFLHDVRTAYKFAREGIPAKVETHYILEPTDTDKRDYLDKIRSDTTLPIAHDVETEDILGVKGPADWRHKTIIQVQFSSGVGEAIVVPFPADREFVQAVYATENMKWGFNDRLSDRLALRGVGITLNGELHDLMNAYLHLQPGFASGKDAADDEDKGVPARLASLQSCVSFYYPFEGVYKNVMRAAMNGGIVSMDDIRYGGARDVDFHYRVGVKLFASLRKLGLW